MSRTRKLLCIGHRGAMGHVPENTIASIRKALELGATAIEVDVRFVDDHLVVIHDDRLERTTDGSGSLADHPYSYLRGLNAGMGEKIPILEEVCSEVAEKALLNIELKEPATTVPVANLITALSRAGIEKNMFLVSAFNHDWLSEISALDPEIRLGALYKAPPFDLNDFISLPGAYSAHIPLESVNRTIVDEAHFRKLKAFVYTVNKAKDIERMVQFGVDGVFTNFPERIVTEYNQPSPKNGWI